MKTLVPSYRVLFLSLLLALVLTGCLPAQRYVDADQGRLDGYTPPLKTLGTVGQSFISRQANLTAVEILLMLHGDASVPAGADEVWRCTLQRSGPQGPAVATVELPLAGRKHNDPVLITFPRQADSQGKDYYISFTAVSGERAALWFSAVDSYAGGAMLSEGQETAGDIRFRTFYDYDVSSALADAAAMAQEGWRIGLAVAVLLTAPGLALYLLAGHPERQRDLIELGAWVASATLALLPLGLLWTTTLGLHWLPWTAWAALAVLAAALLSLCARRRPRVTVRGLDLLALLLLGLIFALRFLQVRDLALPAWVDSVHHTFITDLIVTLGQVPANYEPAFPGSGFFHHFGFHAVAAWVAWVARLQSPQAVLIYGQILNGLVAWTTYLLARRLAGRRIAGVAAMLIVGLISPMPAYYATWGRYTQLAGMALLPLAIVATMDALTRKDWRSLALASITAAGLGLTHYRVAVFYAAFILIYLAYLAWRRRGSVYALQALGLRLAALAGLAFLLLSPWLLRIWELKLAHLLSTPGSLQGAPGQNAMPTGLLHLPGNDTLFVLAGLGALVGLLRRRVAPLLVVLWMAFLYLLVNLPWGSDRGSWFLDNSSLVIALFLPVALLISELASAVWDGLRRLPWQPARWLLGALAPAALVLGLLGAWRQLPILNPQTIIATADDLVAMQWVRENTPPDARFLVNAVPWQLGLYRGSDGGWWIPYLTGRGCTLPPVLVKSASPEFKAEVDAVAEAVSRGELPGGEQWRQRLQALGVRYIYIGARGGPLEAEKLRSIPGLRVAYVHGPVWIFQIE